MGFSFNTALSGLSAASQSISVAGNNIANASTTAYKSSGVSFVDVFSNSSGISLNGAGTTLQSGNGVRIAPTPINFAQGAINNTDTPTNAAIEGNGFFIVTDLNGKTSYSRAGDFSIDRSSYLITPSGHRVQGYAAVNGVVPPGAALTSLTIPIGQAGGPVLTTQATFQMNLNPSDATGTDFRAPLQVYDSKGVSHKLNLAFVKQANGSYNLTATLDGNAAQTSANGGAASATPVNITFDSNGNLTAPTTLSIVPDQTLLNGAALPSINLNLRDANGVSYITNYASPSGVSSADQDGFTASDLIGSQFSTNDGGLYAVFSNGQRRLIGYIALATFNAQGGLSHVGNNLYAETVASGPPAIGIAGTGGRGTIVGSAVEQSNIDLATEFTNLLVAQRSFQANSRVVATISEALQDILQIN